MDMDRLTSDLESSRAERGRLSKQTLELQSQAETLVANLQTQKDDGERNIVIQARLQEELDELRALMEAKTSEEMQRGDGETEGRGTCRASCPCEQAAARAEREPARRGRGTESTQNRA